MWGALDFDHEDLRTHFGPMVLVYDFLKVIASFLGVIDLYIKDLGCIS